MIEGYIENNNIKYNTSFKVIDNNKYVLIIDGNVNGDYYKSIIDSYEKNDVDFANSIIDFISIYLYDKKNNKLLLINDRIGAKKIYYSKVGDKLYFSNDLRLLKIKKTINKKVLSMYFRYHFIPEPNTIIENVYKIEHGNYLIYKKGKIIINKYWSVVKLFNNRVINKDYKKNKENLNKELNNIIIELTKNKKDIGVYVSSGIDSNTIASIYNKVSKNKINAFTIGFDNNRFDESDMSNKISEELKSNHKVLLLKSSEALKNVEKISEYYCEPFGDPSAISTIALNEFARKNNVKVALTGDGADQLFCGAVIYDTMYKIQKYSIVNPFNIKIPDRFLNDRYLFYLFSGTSKDYKSQIDIIYKEKNLDGLFKDDGIKRFNENKIKTNNLQEKRMILDIDTFMAQRVFPKMCIAANKNNIEVVSPFLTKDIIELSFTIPHKYKYHKKNKKYILKDILYDYLPEDLFKGKKRGFTIPTEQWLNGKLNKDLKRLSTKEYIEKQNIFNYEKVNYMINHIHEDVNMVWDYYMFQLWYESNKKDLSLS